ncbi:hypothetical protein ACN47E_002203 [Coniothyrium glycines]
MTRAQCIAYHGGTFDLTQAGESFHNLSMMAADIPDDPGWRKFNEPYTVLGTTNVDLVSNFALPNMTVVTITEGVNFTAGHIGLGSKSQLLKQLKQSSLIPSIGFGLNAGSLSAQKARRGNLVLGGFDQASITSPFYDFPMDYPEVLAGRHCPLQIYIQGLELVLQGQESIQLIQEGDGHSACIEPYDNLFRFSQIGLRNFKDATGWSQKTSYDSDDLFVPEPGLLYPAAASFNGSLKFTFRNGFTVTLPNSELQQPLRGLDKAGSYASEPSLAEVKIYKDSVLAGAWVLGKVFLSRVYLAVDYEARKIHLAEVTQSDVTPSPVRFASVDTTCTSSKLSTGLIVAIVLGAVLSLTLIGGLAYMFFSKHKNHKQPKGNPGHMNLSPIQESREAAALMLATDQATHHWTPLTQEIPADRRISELDPASCVYPPASPRENTRQAPGLDISPRAHEHIHESSESRSAHSESHTACAAEREAKSAAVTTPAPLRRSRCNRPHEHRHDCSDPDACLPHE